jgi:hypothetical protein
MMWQDLVFMIGSGLSILFLAPTLRDASARVPLGTSIPSMGIGVVYGLTFFTLGMTFSALGAIAAGSMWALIAAFRAPVGPIERFVRYAGLSLFVRDTRRWVARRRGDHQSVEQYVLQEGAIDQAGSQSR